MALKATIFKVDLEIADIDRAYYASHPLTLARHPSETDERMMVRLLAFALHAHPDLAFGRGLSTEDEPDLWLKDLTGAVRLWIDVGLPEERAVRKACGRAERVLVVSYGGRVGEVWWDQIAGKLERLKNLTVIGLPASATQTAAALVQRTMQLQCTIQDGQLWLADGTNVIHIEPQILQAPA